MVVDCGGHSFKAGHCMDSKPGIVRFVKDRECKAECKNDNFQECLRDHRFWHSLIGQRSQDLIISLPVWTFRTTKEVVFEMLFEHFAAKSVCMVSSAFLVALAAGSSNGSSTALVVDIGASGTSVTPIEEGYPLTECVARSPVGGNALDVLMSQFLQDAGAVLPDGMTWFEAGKVAKEELAWVAQDFALELQHLKQEVQRPPKPQRCDLVGVGGQRCAFEAIRGEGFRCAEVFFDPNRVGGVFGSDDFPGPVQSLPELVLASLRLQSNINIRGQLLQNVVLVGGMSQLPGLQERLAMEIKRPSCESLPTHNAMTCV